MRLTILGSGTMLPTRRRLPSAFLLEEDKKKVLLDCGHGALARLAELEIDPREIDAVFISHFHTDHMGDAFNLVHARWLGDTYEDKKHKPLVFFGPKTLQERFKKWREIFWPEPKEKYPLEFHEGEFEYKLGNIGIQTFPVKHVPWFDSVGARVNVNEKILVYPGDIGSSHNFEYLIKRTQDADLFLIEAGYENPTPNHFTFEQIEELVRKANIKQVLITHIKHTIKEQERVKRFVQDRTSFRIAEDKMVLEI